MARVLAAIDFSPPSERVLASAAQLCRAFGAELWLLHVAPPDPEFVGYEAGPQSVRDAVAARLADEHGKLGALAAQFSDVDVHPLMVQGVAAERILDHAARLKIDWIVLGSHGHGALYQLVVGSVAEAVLRKATVPVVLVPAATD